MSTSQSLDFRHLWRLSTRRHSPFRRAGPIIRIGGSHIQLDTKLLDPELEPLGTSLPGLELGTQLLV